MITHVVQLDSKDLFNRTLKFLIDLLRVKSIVLDETVI